ncbi:ATP-binding cassette sub-family C member 10 [Aricia agestis]|uniref:ATP-binding cassette sub-family C member 10 n=1 Tax=Aricia agestis TaxID=91739 RepID=UPI001C20AF0F|nr:ATP-binding cassette sub-family C member 10 [Aricia agestis]
MNVFSNWTWRWEDVCGPGGLRPWNETTKDFSMCFQELFLHVPVYFIFAISSSYYIGLRRNWVIREKTQERAIMFRSFAVLALVFTPIIQIYVLLTNNKSALVPIDYFSAGACSLCWVAHFSYVLVLKHRLGQSARGPIFQLLLWGVTVILNVIALRSNIISGESLSFEVANLCFHAVYFLTLLPSSDSRPTYYSQCLVGSQHRHNEYTPLLPGIDEDVLGTAMQDANIFSKIAFCWVNPLLKKGYENKLNDLEELFDLPPQYRCSYVGARIDRALIGNVDNYQQFAEVPHEPFIGSGYGATGETRPENISTPVTPTSRVLVRPQRRQNVSLLRALHTCFGFQFYAIGLLKLVSDMAGFAGPMLLNKLVIFVEDTSIDQHMGYLYALTLLGVTLTSMIFNVHFNWLMSVIGIKMRGAIVSTVLRKTLSVTSTELTARFSVGEVTNFMSTDTDRIVNSCPSFHALWSIPLQLTITLFLLYQQVGVSFLAGVAFSVVLIPVNKAIANKIGELSTELMRHKDARVSLVGELLRGIRAVKLHVWEDYFIERISVARSSEMRYLRARKYLDAVCVVLWATTPVLVAALTLGTHALRGIDLDAPTVFTTVALINMLISPLNAFPWVLNGLTEAWVSIKRIQKLLDLPDSDFESYFDRLNTNKDEDKVLIFKNATFSWAKPSVRPKPAKEKKNKGKSTKKLSKRQHADTTSEAQSTEPFCLQDISLEVGKEELLGVAGPGGSGKTSFLLAIVGEMIKKRGDIQIPEYINSFGYVSQEPWLIRGTIRDNILFGRPYDEAKFKAVVDACALTEDLNTLGWGAWVGAGGCTLSGGQRARVALARAVYADKQVYLLDDALAGVDARVAEHVLRRCVLGLLRHTARVLVAHSPRPLARAHRVVLLRDGRVQAVGPPEAVMNEVEEFLTSEAESVGEEPTPPPPPPPQVPEMAGSVNADGDNLDTVSRHSLDNDESMSEGTIGWWVLALYLRAVGGFMSVAIFLSLVLMQLSQNFTFLWLTFWVNNRQKNSTGVDNIHDTPIDSVHENATILDHGFNAADALVHTVVNGVLDFFSDNNSVPVQPINKTIDQTIDTKLGLEAPAYSNNYYLEMYFVLALVNVLFTIMRAFLFAYGGVKAADKIHKKLLRVIVKAEVKFFDTTPTGRILNRFSSDTYTVDDSLPFILNIFLAQTFSLLGAVILTVYGIPWLLVGVLPMAVIYYRVQRLYRVTSRQLKRLQSVALSPVYAHFNDTLEGLATIRGLGAQDTWACRGEEGVARWQRAALCGAAAAQWLALRLQAPAALALAAAAALAALQRATHAADPGLVGLAISYALSLTSALGNVLNSFTETEREMIAVERVGEYITQVECESVDGEWPPYGWPAHGVVSFDDVVLRYNSRGEPALRGVSFTTHAGERLGVVGRTGAGKSSLLRALARLTPPAAGRVIVDGVDVATLHLHALRSRIGVIPQDPFIFSGSVRENVDPLRQYSEAELWRALEACGAAGAVRAAGGLDAPAPPLSRGHHQLLCLTRALLQRPKILLVDEATAAVDAETERAVLACARGAFAGCTVLWVAHRPAAALDCARVLVLAAGRVLALAAPDAALADPTHPLTRLLHPEREADA